VPSGRRTKAYAARPKATASGHSADRRPFPGPHDKTDTTGKLTLRHNSRLHHIGIAAATPD
jgi:hypothetical protein